MASALFSPTAIPVINDLLKKIDPKTLKSLADSAGVTIPDEAQQQPAQAMPPPQGLTPAQTSVFSQPLPPNPNQPQQTAQMQPDAPQMGLSMPSTLLPTAPPAAPPPMPSKIFSQPLSPDSQSQVSLPSPMQTIDPNQQPDVYSSQHTIASAPGLQNGDVPMSRQMNRVTGGLGPTAPRTSESVRADYEATQKDNGVREHSFWKRFGGGILKGLSEWSANGGQGGIAGLIGAVGTGGAISAASPKFHNNLKQHSAGQKLLGELGQVQKMEEWQTNQDYKKTQIRNIDEDNRQKTADAETRREKWKAEQQLKERNSVLSQVRTMKRYKKGENERFDSQLEALGVEQPDFEPDKKIQPRYWDAKTGKYMTFDENGATVAVLTPDGKEIINDSRREVTYDGFAVSQGAALNAKTQVEVGKVTATNQTNNDNEKHKEKVADLSGKIATSTSRVQNLKTELTRLDGLTGLEKLKAMSEKPNLQKELRDAESELAGFETELKNLPKPAATVSRQTPVINGKYSGRTFASPGALKSAFPNKTEAQIRQIIEANGGKFQQ